MEHFIRECPECQKISVLPREPMLQADLPSYPWEKVASDLFQHKNSTYILVVDYFSRFVEIQKLSSTTSASIVAALKSVFSRHGVPISLVTDNGPQYASQEMTQFSSTYGFNHITSSPHYHQSNGLAKRTVKTIKRMLTTSPDVNLALLSYRATPLPWCGLSPAELSMGHAIRTDVPQNVNKFKPEWSYLPRYQEKEKRYRQDQKQNYDQHHRTRSLPELPNNTSVWVSTPQGQIPGNIVSAAREPRSYNVEVPSSQIRRNCSHLRIRASPPESELITDDQDSTGTIQTRLQTGTQIRPPAHYTDE